MKNGCGVSAAWLNLLGEWMFYIVAILIVLALLKRFSYHLFRKTHHWLAIAYLTLVFHTVVLTQFSYWSQPGGWVLAILMLGGTVSALLVLTGQVGARRKAEGVIESLTYYPGLSDRSYTKGWPPDG